MESMFFIANALTVAILLLAVIYTAGVVWRVELKLDVAYKFFLAAVIFVLAAEILDLYYANETGELLDLIVKTLRLLFAGSFLAGILFMRRIVCDLDGEKK